MKKVTSILLALVMLLILVPTVAFAENEVAQIGNTKYATLAAAIEAVPTNGTEITITMIADEVLATGVTIAANQNIILELAGHTISGNSDQAQTFAVVTNYGTLTIQDRTDTAKNGSGTGLITSYITNPDQQPVPGYASNTITNCGILTVKSGKIVNNGAGLACYAIDNNSSNSDATLTIQGGNMVQNNAYTYAVRMFCNSTTHKNKATVSGGVIEGGYGFWLQTPNVYANIAELTISGGTINARDGYALYVGGTKADDSKIDISVSGGKINGTGVAIQGLIYETDKHHSISFTGGQFVNIAGGNYVTKCISGGIFENVPAAALIADGYEAVPIGMKYVVQPITPEEEKETETIGDLGDVTTDTKEVTNIDTEVLQEVGEVKVEVSETPASGSVADAVENASPDVKTAIAQAKASNTDVEVKVTTVVNVETVEEAVLTDIQAEASENGNTLLKSIDVTVDETVTVKVAGRDPVSNTNEIKKTASYQTITVPFTVDELKSVASSTDIDGDWIVIYRKHEGNVAPMAKAANETIGMAYNGECYWINGNNVVIKANQFSIYALALAEKEVEVTAIPENDDPTPHSGDCCFWSIIGLSALKIVSKIFVDMTTLSHTMGPVAKVGIAATSVIVLTCVLRAVAHMPV